MSTTKCIRLIVPRVDIPNLLKQLARKLYDLTSRSFQETWPRGNSGPFVVDSKGNPPPKKNTAATGDASASQGSTAPAGSELTCLSGVGSAQEQIRMGLSVHKTDGFLVDMLLLRPILKLFEGKPKGDPGFRGSQITFIRIPFHHHLKRDTATGQQLQNQQAKSIHLAKPRENAQRAASTTSQGHGRPAFGDAPQGLL